MIGASQYTMQVSGSTIFVSPLETLPLRNVPVIAPTLPLDEETIDSAAIAAAIKAALKRLDLGDGQSPVAVFVPWRGSATFRRLDDFCKGVADGLAAVLANGHPIVLAGDGDVGGLIGIHYCEEMKAQKPDRLDRRPRAQGVRLYRYRRDPRHFGRRAGRHQVVDLSDHAPAWARTGRRSGQSQSLPPTRHSRCPFIHWYYCAAQCAGDVRSKQATGPAVGTGIDFSGFL